ncbi:O-fucosyltransferase family protein [uncultured Dysgonomonas sp.]|uniref:O-fucosyltransferase family protein n=1 Tax=uncultured Dysgonomonas sp. TaxID=206096 RepID=UPI00260B1B60|nr:O-fucosyltransferase family protein [uncultured Dysgonomonas sp.]
MGKKKVIIYSLTRRGFFSEIINLLIAKTYADINNYDFRVNSFFWNCRIQKGLRDYFIKTYNEDNSVFTAYLTRGSVVKFNLKDPKSYLHNVMHLLNKIYSIYNQKVIYANEIFGTDLTKESQYKIKYVENFRSFFYLNNKVEQIVQRNKEQFDLPKEYIGVHVRRGDKITTKEMGKIEMETYVDSILQKSGELKCKNIYVATDDVNVISFLSTSHELTSLSLYWNKNISQDGFVEYDFNRKSKVDKFIETTNLLTDIIILKESIFFIGTYSSNLSRVIPLFLGFDKCSSLDKEWYLG